MIQDIENYLIENKLGSDSPYFTAMISATTNLLYDTNHKSPYSVDIDNKVELMCYHIERGAKQDEALQMIGEWHGGNGFMSKVTDEHKKRIFAAKQIRIKNKHK